MILFNICSLHWLIPWILLPLLGLLVGYLLWSKWKSKYYELENELRSWKSKYANLETDLSDCSAKRAALESEVTLVRGQLKEAKSSTGKSGSSSAAKKEYKYAADLGAGRDSGATTGIADGGDAGSSTTGEIDSVTSGDTDGNEARYAGTGLGSADLDEKENDYLSSHYYEGHPVNDRKNNVAFFKHTDGQYYFVMYNPDGSIKLRSEGFKTAKQRDQELSGVLRFHDDPSKYNRKEIGKYYMDILYDDKGVEVGRSGLQKKGDGKAGTGAGAGASGSTTTQGLAGGMSSAGGASTGAGASGGSSRGNIYAALKSDNLQVVEGIGPKMDSVLKKHGIHTWKELGESTPESLRAILDKENASRYRIIDPTTWPHQARLANQGDWDRLIQDQKQLDTGKVGVSGETDSKVEKLLVKMGVLKKWKQDDLKAVEGIGPKIEQLLHNAGIKTWKALSETPTSKIQEVLDNAGSRYKLADPGTWPKQAGMAASGKWDELQEYQDFLQGGK